MKSNDYSSKLGRIVPRLFGSLAIRCALFGMVKWPFQGLSNLRLGRKKVTLNHLECEHVFEKQNVWNQFETILTHASLCRVMFETTTYITYKTTPFGMEKNTCMSITSRHPTAGTCLILPLRSQKVNTWQQSPLKNLRETPLKTNIDTQNDGLETLTPFRYGHFLLSMLNFLRAHIIISQFIQDNPKNISFPLCFALRSCQPSTCFLSKLFLGWLYTTGRTTISMFIGSNLDANLIKPTTEVEDSDCSSMCAKSPKVAVFWDKLIPPLMTESL